MNVGTCWGEERRYGEMNVWYAAMGYEERWRGGCGGCFCSFSLRSAPIANSPPNGVASPHLVASPIPTNTSSSYDIIISFLLVIPAHQYIILSFSSCSYKRRVDLIISLILACSSAGNVINA